MSDIITIKTPQFKNGKVDRWHTQKGTIDTKTWIFTPLNKTNGDHEVHFHNEANFKFAIV